MVVLAVDCSGRTSTCSGCGKSLACRSAIGRLPKWCDPCRKAAKAKGEKGRKRKAWQELQSKPCEQCGQEWKPKRRSTRFCSPRCRSLASGDRLVLSCACCGESFECCSAYAKARKYCSRECSRKHHGVQERSCVECGKSFKRSPHSRDKAKYCGRACYFAARNAGRQAWDRTRQLEGVWHRGGPWACAPSKKPMQEMMTNMGHFLGKLRILYGKAVRKMPACETCGEPCKREEARFCSPKCCGQNVVQVECHKCGSQCERRGVGKKAMCYGCKEAARKEELRRRRETYGRNHPSRARHLGVKCARFPRKTVFERDGWRCQLCGKPVLRKTTYRKPDGKIHSRSPTVDCIVPMSRGGNYEPDNCQTACFICNSRKGARLLGQMRLPLS
jgi:hypothetical protein